MMTTKVTMKTTTTTTATTTPPPAAAVFLRTTKATTNSQAQGRTTLKMRDVQLLGYICSEKLLPVATP